jgi:uncharacterized protein involved in exopolysaccharide biosynthesis
VSTTNRISENPQESGSGFDFQEYLRTLWRKKYFILVPVVLSVCVAVIGVRFIPPVYESFALVRMEDKNYLSGDMAKLLPAQEHREVVDKETLARMEAQVHSSFLIDDLIARLGVAENPQLVAAANEDRESRFPDMSTDELVRRTLQEILIKKIKVTLAGPGIFKIACYDNRPETSYMLADAVTDLFVETQLKKQLRGLQIASEFSDEQLALYKERLERSEQELENTRNRLTALALRGNPVGETSKEYAEEFGGESNLRYAETLKSELDVTVAELGNTVNRLQERLVGLLGEIPKGEPVWQDSEIRTIEASITSHRETQLLLELGAKGVTTTDLENKQTVINQTVQQLQHQLTLVVDAKYPQIRPEYRPLVVEYFYQIALWRSFEKKRARLESYISDFKEKIDAAPRLEAEVEKLKAQVDADRDLYNSFLRARSASQVSEGVQSTDLGITTEVVEKPVRPFFPVRPNRRDIVLLALIFGASFGLAGLLISEYTDTSFRTVQEIETKLGLRVLGTIPQVDPQVQTSWGKTRARKQMALWSAIFAFVIVLSLVGFVYYGKVVQKKAIHIDTSAVSGK